MTTVGWKNEYAIGIDIGGTKTLAALVNAKGEIVRSVRFASEPEQGPDRYLARLAGAALQLKEDSERLGGKLLGIGAASAGVIDSRQGAIVFASNLNWRDVPVGGYLSQQTGLTVKLGNDANMAAVAEYVWGAGERVRDLIYVTVSTGIGAGIISGGQLVEGASDSAGEFGHISTNLYGPRCACGNYGCLENYSSGTAIAARANERLGARAEGPWTTREVLEASAAGDPGALEIVREAAFHLGNGMTTLIHLFNPRRIVLGGGVMDSGDLLLRETVRTIDERCLRGLRRGVGIVRTNLGAEIGVLGAAGQFFAPAAGRSPGGNAG